MDAPLGSAEWWRDRLARALVTRQAHVSKLRAYYDGEHPLPVMPTSRQAVEAESAYRRLLQMGRTNWVRLVADAPAERLEVIGFRSAKDETADADVWAIWQENQLDADADLVHLEALKVGQAFAMVWKDPETGRPSITVEDPEQVIVAYRPGTRRTRAAALKAWTGDDGFLRATLYLPGEVYKWRARSAQDASLLSATWDQAPDAGEDWPLRHPLGVVPVVEFRANPGLRPAPFGGGCSEFEGVIDIQDRINRVLFQRLLAGEFAAFRQRWVAGMDLEEDEAGNPVEPFRAAINRLWVVDDPNVKFGEFQATDLGPFIQAVEADVTHLAAITKTPPHYLLGKEVNISAEALKAAEAGLVAKTRRHRGQLSEAWEEVLRLALKVLEDPRADDPGSMVLWGDIEQRTWAETVDAVTKMAALGVPEEALWAMLPGVTPQDIARWRSMSTASKLLEGLVGPAAAPVPPALEPSPAPPGTATPPVSS